jgi:squalene cyclase
MRALQMYAPKSTGSAYETSVQSALNWLTLAHATNTEERAFRLLAFGWAKASREMIDAAARELIAEQRPDGGWSQLLHMQSDAYASGEALVALQEAAGLPANHRSIQRGVQFLLETQLEDGSWLVKTRSIPIQPYIESGFPHGEDQWISAAATNWATKALTLALKRR